jgi:hypothetical protein
MRITVNDCKESLKQKVLKPLQGFGAKIKE